MSKVEFNPKTHTYIIDGEKYPSVTQILGVAIATPALVPWAAKITVGYLSEHLDKVISGELKLTEENASEILFDAKKRHQKIKEEAGDIGTQAHKLVEKINRGETISDSEWDSLDVRVQNAVNAYKKWRDKTGYVAIKNEQIIYSKKYKYAGTLDSLGEINNKLVLVDFKTSNNLYPEFWLQLSAYWNAYKELSPDQEITDVYIVRFGKEDGDFEAININDVSLMRKHFKTFLSALNIYWWKKEQDKKWRGKNKEMKK